MSLDEYGPGRVIGGRYMIARQVGEGGTAVVFCADDLYAPRAVALKISREPGGAASANLLREAEALRRVQHPRIARLLDSGSLPDGRTYLVTTFIAGTTLRAHLLKGPLTPGAARVVCAAIAGAVWAMHDAGLLHRDLKPENVMLPHLDARPLFARATLIDLGVFGELGQRTVTGASQTRWGRVSGTPWYMAPEQLAGRPQTPATDVYGLGVLLYELLFGRPPMAEEPVSTVAHPANGGLVAFLGPFVRRRLTEEVTIPDSPRISPELRDLLAWMLRTAPDNRPLSMFEVVHALRTVVANELQC